MPIMAWHGMSAAIQWCCDNDDMLCCMEAYENSHTRDYVTEKVYDALAVGCVPIYWGAPNFENYLQQPNAVINP